MKACKMASLRCKSILSEPISAAFFVAWEERVFQQLLKKTWLVFDLGGGTLDLAIVKVGNYALETMAIDGDQHLGG